MSAKSRRSLSLRTLKKQCKAITLKKQERVFILSSPFPEATFATAILCRAFQRAQKLYHVSFCDVVVNSESIKLLRSTYPKHEFIIVGSLLSGKKKLGRKGGYPLLIGSETTFTSDVPSIGSLNTICPSAYVYSKENLTTNDMDLQTAAVGALTQGNPKEFKAKASTEIVELAKEKSLLKQRKGAKLFGTSFLPLNQVLQYSIHPYLQGISGVPDSCEKILDDADIPLTKRSSSLTDLTKDERKRLNERLVQNDLRYESPTIHSAFGEDYILTNESEKSPLHFLSGIRSLGDVAWSRWELGFSTGVWIGDRSRMMENLIIAFKKHSQDVVSGAARVREMFEDIESDDSLYLTPKSPLGRNVTNKVLADLSRITFEIGLASKDKYLVLYNDTHVSVSWNQGSTDILTSVESFKEGGFNAVSTSNHSIELEMTSKDVYEGVLGHLENLEMNAG
ncbi:MAG: hypothetical protein ACW99U_01550 [Candidatus Thorarchaeota archaeon]